MTFQEKIVDRTVDMINKINQRDGIFCESNSTEVNRNIYIYRGQNSTFFNPYFIGMISVREIIQYGEPLVEGLHMELYGRDRVVVATCNYHFNAIDASDLGSFANELKSFLQQV